MAVFLLSCDFFAYLVFLSYTFIWLCQDNLCFDLLFDMYHNMPVISQSALLPRMGGVDITPILPRMGVGYFIKRTKE